MLLAFSEIGLELICCTMDRAFEYSQTGKEKTIANDTCHILIEQYSLIPCSYVPFTLHLCIQFPGKLDDQK